MDVRRRFPGVTTLALASVALAGCAGGAAASSPSPRATTLDLACAHSSGAGTLGR